METDRSDLYFKGLIFLEEWCMKTKCFFRKVILLNKSRKVVHDFD